MDVASSKIHEVGEWPGALVRTMIGRVGRRAGITFNSWKVGDGCVQRRRRWRKKRPRVPTGASRWFPWSRSRWCTPILRSSALLQALFCFFVFFCFHFLPPPPSIPPAYTRTQVSPPRKAAHLLRFLAVPTVPVVPCKTKR